MQRLNADIVWLSTLRPQPSAPSELRSEPEGAPFIFLSADFADERRWRRRSKSAIRPNDLRPSAQSAANLFSSVSLYVQRLCGEICFTNHVRKGAIKPSIVTTRVARALFFRDLRQTSVPKLRRFWNPKSCFASKRVLQYSSCLPRNDLRSTGARTAIPKKFKTEGDRCEALGAKLSGRGSSSKTSKLGEKEISLPTTDHGPPMLSPPARAFRDNLRKRAKLCRSSGR